MLEKALWLNKLLCVNNFLTFRIEAFPLIIIEKMFGNRKKILLTQSAFIGKTRMK